MATKQDIIYEFAFLGIPLPDVWPENTNSGYALILSSWILFAVATFLLTGRYYTKIMILKRFSLDDWTMLLAWVSRHPRSLTLPWART